MNDGIDESGYVRGSNHELIRDYKEYNMLFEDVTIYRQNATLRTPLADIVYLGNVEELPEKIRGTRADVVEIYDNCISEEAMLDLIYPLVEGDNTKIKFKV